MTEWRAARKLDRHDMRYLECRRDHGFLFKREALYMNADAETGEWSALCTASWNQDRDHPITTKDLFAVAKDFNLLLISGLVDVLYLPNNGLVMPSVAIATGYSEAIESAPQAVMVILRACLTGLNVEVAAPLRSSPTTNSEVSVVSSSPDSDDEGRV